MVKKCFVPKHLSGQCALLQVFFLLPRPRASIILREITWFHLPQEPAQVTLLRRPQPAMVITTPHIKAQHNFLLDKKSPLFHCHGGNKTMKPHQLLQSQVKAVFLLNQSSRKRSVLTWVWSFVGTLGVFWGSRFLTMADRWFAPFPDKFYRVISHKVLKLSIQVLLTFSGL